MVTSSLLPAVSLLGSFDVGFTATAVSWYKDEDNDGRSDGTIAQACARPAGYKTAAELTLLTGDCNDADATIYPGATELCDTKDNNCNGVTDEGCPSGSPTWYRDADKDGFGNLNFTKVSDTKPKGYVSNSLDCSDWLKTVYPGAPELPDGLDNDCDGEVDEGLVCRDMWYLDRDGDGYGYNGSFRYSCVQPGGWVMDNTDCKDFDPNTHPGAAELCDGKDNDCDGQKDEGCVPPGFDPVKPAGNVVTRSMGLAETPSTQVKLWPNPAVDEFYIQLNGFDAGKKLAIQVVRLDGRAAKERDLVPSAANQQVRIDTRNIGTGYYLVQLKQGSISQTHKMVIVR